MVKEIKLERGEERIHRLLKNPELIEDCLNYFTELYNEKKDKDKGIKFYKELLNKFKNNYYNPTIDKETIERIYFLLDSWGMNRRGAKLSDKKIFCDSIINNKDDILEIQKYKIEELEEKNDKFNSLIKIYEKLFENLNLVDDNKPKLVTFSKTLHFLAPNLIVPIDGKNTLNFFNMNNGNNKKDKSKDKSFERFLYIQKEFINFSKKIIKINYIKDNILKKDFEEREPNFTIPKIIDNIIMGY